MSNRRFPLLLACVAWGALVYAARDAHAVCTTPGNGTTYALPDLVGICPDITGSANTYSAADSLIVSATDTLALGPGVTLETISGANVTIEGNLNVGALAADPAVLRGQGGANWDGLILADDATATVQGLRIEDALVGITVNNLASVSWSDVTVSGSVGDGFLFSGTEGSVNLNRVLVEGNGGAGVHFVSCPSVITLSAVESASNDIGYLFEGVGRSVRILASVARDNAAEGVLVTRGGSRLLINDTEIVRNGAAGVFADARTVIAGDALTIQSSTLAENTGPAVEVHGVASHRIISSDLLDGLADGVVWTDVKDAELRFSDVARSAGHGVNVDGATSAYAAVQDETPTWIAVGPLSADMWEPTGDSTTLGPIGLPFGIEIGGVVYDQFVQHADGVIELLETAQVPVGPLSNNGWTVDAASVTDRALIFAQRDDWCADCDPNFDAAGDFRGFGFQYLQEGELDEDGVKVADDTMAFVWHMQAVDDVGAHTGRNDFAVYLHPDGRVRWSVSEMQFVRAFQGVFSGLIQSDGDMVVASRYARTPVTYTFDPLELGLASTPTTLNGNNIDLNGAAGVSISRGLRFRAWDNAITSNLVGLLHTGDSEQTRLVFNNIEDNGPTPGTAEVENDQAGALTARDNYWGVTEETSIDQAILDDEEDGGRGAVTFTPFRLSPIQPGPPPAVASFSGEPQNKRALFQWEPSDAPDAASYLLRWGTNAQEPQNTVEIPIENTEETLDGLTNGQKYFAYLSVVDLAGNVGTASTQIEVVPRPDPDPPKGLNKIFGCKCSVGQPAHGVPPVWLLLLLVAPAVIVHRVRSRVTER